MRRQLPLLAFILLVGLLLFITLVPGVDAASGALSLLNDLLQISPTPVDDMGILPTPGPAIVPTDTGDLGIVIMPSATPAGSLSAPTEPSIVIMPSTTPADAALPAETASPAETDATATSPSVAANDDLGILPAFGGERLTIVVLGTDTRPSEAEIYSRTDSIMLMSLDPATNRVGVLGIPRDLWVAIPGYGYQRINLAYTIGESWQPGTGPQLLEQTVQATFGMPVDHYVMLDFSTFVNVIDLIGGIDVLVEEPISDPTYPDASYGYDPFYLDAGQQHLDGATALKYSRSRHNSDDRVRIKRQQQVMMAVFEKATSAEMFPVLLRAMPELWDAVSQGVQTDLTLADLMDLALYARAIPPENIVGEVMDWRYAPATMIGDQSVLVPNTATIPGLLVELFGSTYAR
ncbi:LCP family protein [Aggregatilinea lenta]|uniref:LCP family protein n=1 Tax=Aggregatilinea lenta TaxID=913108 RepID=UPI000E5B58FF|nr:LCP family protein [Aggregatilinea lenta]